MSKHTLLFVNFGGPRNLSEVEEFLITLLTDQEVVRTGWPSFLHRWFFTRIAKKRSKRVSTDYSAIGGRSPIHEDTEAVASLVKEHTGLNVITFHRYLPQTHKLFLTTINHLPSSEKITVFPFFPQFSCATTGSIALWMNEHLPPALSMRLEWVKSYPDHVAYVDASEEIIRECLKEKKVEEKEVILLFSAHGVPQKFVDTGDVYQEECLKTYEQLKSRFPQALSKLSYQSQFGKALWLRPSTKTVCEEIESWNEERKFVIVVPLSFTSDHIETLFEIEEEYLPLIRKKGIEATRCPALNRSPQWIQAIGSICENSRKVKTQQLLRKK